MTQTTVPVIFDLDGTLVDPAGGITDGIAAALTRAWPPVPGQVPVDAMIGPKLSHSLTEHRRRSGRHARRRHPDLPRALPRHRHRAEPAVPGNPGAPGSFVAAGRPIAVATQKPEGLARTVLEHHGIAGLFHTIRGSAADEAAAGRPEPVREGRHRRRRAGGPLPRPCGTQHAVMVGDRAQDVAGAAANGLDCIGVGWGFAPDGELDEAGRRGDRARHHGASRRRIEQTLRTPGDHSR